MPFSDPEQILRQFSLGNDWHVADFGAGSGAYVFAAARRLSDGKVYAVDINRGLIERIKKDAGERGFKNVEVFWGDVEDLGGSKLKDASMDAVIVANVLFQVGSKKGVAEEVGRVLKEKRRVLLIDWTDSFGGLGPHANLVFPKEKARELFEANGFAFEQEINAGEHHYGLVFKKK
ncbi:MAG TPA: class I SAM-dependent methyltransferase [Candidatus Paceibacterota bacterium]